MRLYIKKMSKHLITEKEINQKLQRMKGPIESEAQVNEMMGKYAKVFQGIGCHKYRQIKLYIDPTVTHKIQPQRKIPFAKRGPLEEILSELEKEDIIEEVQGPTEWISNLVLTPKSDGKLRMNIDMTTVNSAIKRTRHVIPRLEELRY